MLLDAARRFNLCLRRAEVRNSSPWPAVDDAVDDGMVQEERYLNMELNDLLPSPELTRRAGYKPKFA